jgi:hypothetical protein
MSGGLSAEWTISSSRGTGNPVNKREEKLTGLDGKQVTLGSGDPESSKPMSKLVKLRGTPSTGFSAASGVDSSDDHDDSNVCLLLIGVRGVIASAANRAVIGDFTKARIDVIHEVD